MFREKQEGPSGAFRFGEYELDPKRGVLSRKGIELKLQPQPFRVLELLVARAPNILTREELGNYIWGDGVHVDLEQSINYCIRQIRQVLNDNAAKPRFVDTLPKQGYRFVASVLQDQPSSGTLPQPLQVQDTNLVDPPRAGAAPKSERDTPPLAKRRFSRIALLIGCVALLTTAIGWLVQKRLHAAAPIHSLAVLPLENLSGDPSQDYFADGMTDELITELARIPALRVVSRTSVMQDKGVRKPLRQIAQELDVDAIIEGSIVRSADNVRITAQLVDTRTDKHLWAQSFEGKASDILSLQDSVASEIAAQAKVALMLGARAAKPNARRVDPAAHDDYLRGLYFLHKRESVESAAYFQNAISIDPLYAPAHAGLALALTSESALGVAKPEEVTPKAAAAAKRAIALDPENGQAYTALGSIETIYEWKWADAERDLKRGIALSPNDSLAEMNYAVFLDAINRPEDAVTHMRRAVELDPLSFFMNRHLGSTLFFARHYDEALVYLQRAREMEPSHPNVVENWTSWVYEKKGMQDEAVDYDLVWLSPGHPRSDRLRAIYKHDGWRAYWQAHINDMQPGSWACNPYFVGVNYLRLGDRDHAFERFNKAVDNHCLWVVFLKVDPLLDDLRTDKRYIQLLQRVNLAER